VVDVRAELEPEHTLGAVSGCETDMLESKPTAPSLQGELPSESATLADDAPQALAFLAPSDRPAASELLICGILIWSQLGRFNLSRD
jgi:hypothetical protein